jgi:flagellum-specific peptidoglycan hydrolase FlgJ
MSIETRGSLFFNSKESTNPTPEVSSQEWAGILHSELLRLHFSEEAKIIKINELSRRLATTRPNSARHERFFLKLKLEKDRLKYERRDGTRYEKWNAYLSNQEAIDAQYKVQKEALDKKVTSFGRLQIVDSFLNEEYHKELKVINKLVPREMRSKRPRPKNQLVKMLLKAAKENQVKKVEAEIPNQTNIFSANQVVEAHSLRQPYPLFRELPDAEEISISSVETLPPVRLISSPRENVKEVISSHSESNLIRVDFNREATHRKSIVTGLKTAVAAIAFFVTSLFALSTMHVNSFTESKDPATQQTYLVLSQEIATSHIQESTVSSEIKPSLQTILQTSPTPSPELSLLTPSPAPVETILEASQPARPSQSIEIPIDVPPSQPLPTTTSSIAQVPLSASDTTQPATDSAQPQLMAPTASSITPPTPPPGVAQDFWTEAVYQARIVQYKYGLPASLTLSQIIKESGGGKYHVGKNLFGIKGTGPAGSVSADTSEISPAGERYATVASFRAYNSFSESIEDYAKLLAEGRPFRRVQELLQKGSKDPGEYTQALNGIYATNPDYTNSLNQIISKYNLTQYDLSS